MDDNALLHEYAERNSEEAFAQIVERHIGFVYSTALRRVGNPSRAEEVTQAVFVILARKARTFDDKVILPSWLYHTTRLTASNLIRQEARRALREQEAYMQSITEAESTDAWPLIAPLLEKAVDRLGSKEREAILLRFFENQSMKEIGHTCGTTENAAKKRVNRGLEKMRRFFSKSGVVLTAAAIAEAVSGNGVHAAPLGLATNAAAAAHNITTLSITTSALIETTLKTLAWQKLRLALGTWVLLLAAGATILLGSRVGSGPGPRTAQMYYAEGTFQDYRYDQQGNEVAGNGLGERAKFSFRGVGCQWTIRLMSDTNLPGGITDLGCDGTNIYVFVPGAGGTSRVGNELKAYKNAGSIWPGQVKVFNSLMVPLWWGYCSGCVLNGDGQIPDFLGVSGQGGIDGELILRHSGTNDLQPRLGPREAQLYPTQSQFDNRLPIAMIRPETAVTNNGIVFVTKWSFTHYRTVATTKSTNKAPEPLEKFEVELTKFGIDQTSESFIPPMTDSTEVQDYRFQRMETYLTDHWLNIEDATELLWSYR